ncbi:endolytic transglycosylase MltG [Campylobacter pinnipediorum]|uniref:endolytic transglycosylase MltG n=1 Tax=Campylobacter pinnipediorum TaxID=1965231 RepID=UPI00084D13DA
MIKNIKKISIAFMIFDTFFIFALSVFFYLSQPINTSRVVFVPKGGVSEIITYLASRNFKLSSIDKYVVVFLGHIQSGWIDMKTTKLSRIDFLKQLTVAKAAMTKITLIPGETNVVFLNDIANQLKLDSDKLLQEYKLIAPLQDGYLIPDTYVIPIGMSEKHLIYYLVNLSKKIHKELSNKIYGEYNERKWNKILTIASIVQKEAANDNEMPLVASVIYNRLAKNMRLQMDGTLNYGKYSHEKVTAQRIRSDNSEFNTYLNNGLPPSPVCAVSINAIKAAISPAKSDYLYFVLDRKNKRHKFSKTLKEHNENIK